MWTMTPGSAPEHRQSLGAVGRYGDVEGASPGGRADRHRTAHAARAVAGRGRIDETAQTGRVRRRHGAKLAVGHGEAIRRSQQPLAASLDVAHPAGAVEKKDAIGRAVQRLAKIAPGAARRLELFAQLEGPDQVGLQPPHEADLRTVELFAAPRPGEIENEGIHSAQRHPHHQHRMDIETTHEVIVEFGADERRLGQFLFIGVDGRLPTAKRCAGVLRLKEGIPGGEIAVIELRRRRIGIWTRSGTTVSRSTASCATAWSR
jgi:hypothetical protein